MLLRKAIIVPFHVPSLWPSPPVNCPDHPVGADIAPGAAPKLDRQFAYGLIRVLPEVGVVNGSGSFDNCTSSIFPLHPPVVPSFIVPTIGNPDGSGNWDSIEFAAQAVK